MSDGTIKKASSKKILLPVFIGFAVVGYMFYKEVKHNNLDIAATLSNIDFTWKTALMLLLAFVCMAGRDIGYMIRMRVLSEKQLTWAQTFRIIMLWEFTSAITPSSVGGTSVAMVYVHKEGVSVGRSSAIIMVTSLLDELYFVVMLPLILLFLEYSRLFDVSGVISLFGFEMQLKSVLKTMVFIAYALKLIWLLALGYGMFKNPRGLSRLIFGLFNLRLLKRWRRGAARAVKDIEATSIEMKTKKPKYWFEAILSTFLSWTSRFLVVNFMFMAFFPVHEHILVFGRQLIMSLALLVCPTPGGAGFAEAMFDAYLSEFIPIAGLTILLVFLWRLISYYPYLLIGAAVIPKWVDDNFVSKSNKDEEN